MKKKDLSWLLAFAYVWIIRSVTAMVIVGTVGCGLLSFFWALVRSPGLAFLAIAIVVGVAAAGYFYHLAKRKLEI